VAEISRTRERPSHFNLLIPSPLLVTQHYYPSSAIMASSAAPHHKHSCVLCARRKIKCDKQDPRCSNCSKSHAECIYQAPHPPQRRKRQTDDELISRLNHYEELLRSHKIDFKPINNVWTSQPVPETQQVTTSRGTPQSATVTETVPSPSVQFGVG
jgi:hypothetical protein